MNMQTLLLRRGQNCCDPIIRSTHKTGLRILMNNIQLNLLIVTNLLVCVFLTIVIYRYLFGLHAFGLEETNFYREAEKQARKVHMIVHTQCKSLHYMYEIINRTKLDFTACIYYIYCMCSEFFCRCHM